MTSVPQLKKEIQMLERVLNVEPENKKGEEIIRLLKEYEELGLSGEQERAVIKEVVADLWAKGVW